MLSRILQIINNSESKIESGTLICNNYVINDLECLSCLLDKDCLEQTIYIDELKKGDKIDLELNLYRLKSLGFYYYFNDFIQKNKYEIPIDDYYIFDIKCSKTNQNEAVLKYEAIINLINSIKNIAKHNFKEIDIENSIIYKDDRSLLLPFNFESSDITSINKEFVNLINEISELFNKDRTEKKLLYLNELIDYLTDEKESSRFTFLLSNFSDYYERCNNAYQFYLRDFSYNKLKIEIDSKALGYTQKIQTIINESQTKLIAIPTAFVLVFATFDFIDLFAIKNIADLIGLFVFAIIIQLFLNNQKSALNFIKDNISSYKESFQINDIEKISNRFKIVDQELKKQRIRFLIVECILWLIPLIFTSYWLFLRLHYTILLLLYLL